MYITGAALADVFTDCRQGGMIKLAVGLFLVSRSNSFHVKRVYIHTNFIFMSRRAKWYDQACGGLIPRADDLLT